MELGSDLNSVDSEDPEQSDLGGGRLIDRLALQDIYEIRGKMRKAM